MMTAIRINDSVIYDLSYVIDFDNYNLFYINMAIKNIRIHLYSYIIYDLSYVMDFDTCHLFYISMPIKNARMHLYGYINIHYISRIKEGMTIKMITRIYTTCTSYRTIREKYEKNKYCFRLL